MATLAVAPVTDRRFDAAFAVLRVVVGLVFAAHGAQKLFVFGVAGASQMLGGMGVPLPGVAGPLLVGVEFLGGLALVLGVLTRLAALGLAIDMLGAMFLVHLAGGFFMPKGVEFALTLFGACVALMLAGAGAYSLDAAIGRARSWDRS